MEAERVCDVLIIGAGMAGACLARQLTLEAPDLTIMMVERKKEFDWWVGESSIEVFDDYANRNLKLGPYLASRHIVKHGLRFWFDNADHNLRMCELSEQGRTRYTSLNRGVQIDRARFDRDLCAMNRANGVEVLLDTQVPSGEDRITIDPNGHHSIRTTRGTIRCRYLVDAAGRTSPLVRHLGLGEQSTPEQPDTGAYWVRVAGCNYIDDLGDDAWRRRVDNTLRWSSTNHFMYDGYWIWLIPLDDEVVSIGVTFDRKIAPMRIRNGNEMVEFLRGHRALGELLGESFEVLDFLGFGRLTRGATRYFSEDRWYLTGMSGLFVDPLFSGNSGFIAVNNRLIASLIEADRAGDARVVANRVRHFNIHMRNVFKRAASSFSTYHHFGSFDAFVAWQTLRYHSILNYEVAMQHADYQPLIARYDSHGENCDCAVGKWSAGQSLGEAGDRLTREFVSFLDERGAYYARNEGYFHDKTEREEIRTHTMQSGFERRQERISRIDYEAFFRYLVGRMCRIDRIAFSEKAFSDSFQPDWREGQSLKEVFDAQVRGRAAESASDSPPAWDIKGPVDPDPDEHLEWRNRFIGPG